MFGIMLFPSIVKSVIIIVFSLIIFFLVYNRGFVFNKTFFIINSSIYIGFIITMLYTSNFSEASLKLQTSFSLLLFPLLFSMLKMPDVLEVLKNSRIYLVVFIVATFLYNLIPFLWYYFTHYSLEDVIEHYPLIIIKDIGTYSIHPIYMSMHCAISILFSIYLFRDVKRKLNKFLLFFINIILLYFLIVYSKKAPFIAFVSVLFLWSFFKDKKIRKYYFFAIIATSILLISIPKTRNKFSELIKVEDAKSISSNSTNIRFSIYKTSFFLIKNSPFIGYGIGDFNDQLKIEYKKNIHFLLSKEYNSHNQYLSFLLIGGIPLLFLYLYFLYYNINLSINYKNHLLIVVLSFYSIVMLSENILERENGVIFFSFLINFFALNNYTKDEC